MSKKIEKHNIIAKSINNISLFPIENELSVIREYVKPAFEFPASDDGTSRITVAWQRIKNLIKDNKEVLYVNHNYEWSEFQSMLCYACDNYIHNRKSAILDKDEFLEECLCDLLSLLELLNVGVGDLDRYATRECAIEAYLLCMLTQNMIQSTQNIQMLNLGKGYQHIDNLYVRLFLEEELVPFVLDFYGLIHNDLTMINDKTELLKTFHNTRRIVDVMYASFCNNIFDYSFDDIDEKYIPPSDPKWMEYYSEIARILQLPI